MRSLSRRLVLPVAVVALAGVWVPPAVARPQAAAPAAPAAAKPVLPINLAAVPWLRQALGTRKISGNRTLVSGGTAQVRGTSRSTRVRLGNFRDCPALPPGVDRSTWNCFVTHVVGGRLQIGRSDQIITEPITTTFAIGFDADFNLVTLFGRLRAEPARVPGGIFLIPEVDRLVRRHHDLRLSVQPVGVGVAPDPTGASAAELQQKIKSINVLLGRTCFIGSDSDPIRLHPTFGTTSPPPPNQPISGSLDTIDVIGNEVVTTGTLVDNSFAAPSARGCGPNGLLTEVVNERGALPSPAGTNTAIFKTIAELISYTNLPG